MTTRPTSELAILVPVLGRPHRVRPLLESIAAATTGWRACFVCDEGDNAEIAAILKVLGEFPVEIMVHTANYAGKVNEAIRRTTEPLLFLGADDLHFHPGWLEAAKAKLTDDIGVVGTNDLGSKRVMAGEHSTHSLVTRDYVQQGTIDDPSRLLHEGYPHEFVDDEFVETAKARGAFASAHDSVVEHLHPNWGKAPVDALYAQQRRRMRVGRRIFAERRALWT